MHISLEEIKKTAKLARINLTEKEEKYYAETISVVLDYVDILDEVDVEGIDSIHSVVGLKNIVREDVAIESKNKKALISQMPDIYNNNLVVHGVFK